MSKRFEGLEDGIERLKKLLSERDATIGELRRVLEDYRLRDDEVVSSHEDLLCPCECDICEKAIKVLDSSPSDLLERVEKLEEVYKLALEMRGQWEDQNIEGFWYRVEKIEEALKALKEKP